MKEPPHPGSFVRTEVIGPLGLTTEAAAEVLGISAPTLFCLFSGAADLSDEMATRIESVFGVRAEILLRMQGAYDSARGLR